jgi:hypothetical protein
MTPRPPRAVAAAILALGLAVGLGLGAPGCGGPQRSDPAGDSAVGPAPAVSRSPIERRRDAACDALGPKLTACAVADARADFATGKIDRHQLDLDTAPEWQQKLTAKWLADCKGARYSSRQIRVLEVCFREETECGPLVACLDHLRDQVGPGK